MAVKTTAISPLDGRYRKSAEPLRIGGASISQLEDKYAPQTNQLRGVIGEKELARSRIMVEGAYLIHLSEQNLGMRRLTETEKAMIGALYDVIDEDVDALKAIEFRGWEGIKATNHDVKAIEYFIRKALEDTPLSNVLEWTHFALTSEDTNSMAYGLMLSDALGKVVIPKIEELCERMDDFGELGEKTRARLERQLKHLKGMEVLVKLNGATGNYNAHSVAFPHVDVNGWLKFTEDFVSGFNEGRTVKLRYNPITTQIEPHDNYAAIFDAVKRVNTILAGFTQEMGHECESNPGLKERFREVEASFAGANALGTFFSAKLPISRLQRDLSDSTVERNFGVALGYSVTGYSLLLDKSLDGPMKGFIPAREAGREAVRNDVMAVPVEDKDRLSYKLRDVVVSKIEELRDVIGKFAETNAAIPIAARTHGQFALPTTFGKEFHVFRARMNRQLKELKERIAHADSVDGAAEALDNLRRINTILIDFDQDVWRYISDDWLKQTPVDGEVGSSTMAQKVNPIDFENSEGNAGLSNAILAGCSATLLLWGASNSLVMRNIDEALSHTLIAYNSALKGMGKISVNEEKVKEVLAHHLEVLAEPIQIILRREGVPGAYERLKDLTRGKRVTETTISAFIAGLDVEPRVREELEALTPQRYTGMAEALVRVE
jgi:adenylosuccinate lyase